MGMDLSYLEQLMGGASESGGDTGGVWVVSPDGAFNDAMLRLVGKARSLADALGGYVYLLAGCGGAGGDPQRAIRAGADNVLTANGMPGVNELAEYLRERQPQVVLFPRTAAGRGLAGGLAQALGGALCHWAADLAVDPIYQRIVVHQPVLDDAARQIINLTGTPAIAAVDTELLPAGFDEPWRTGNVEDTGLAWPEPVEETPAELPTRPLTLRTAPVIVAAGMGLRDEAGFALAKRLAEALGGIVAGDVTALDAGWINEEQLVGLTGHEVAPRVYLALGIDGDTSQFMATMGAGCIVAVQEDAEAPIVKVADYNIIGDPVEVAQALLAELK